MNKNTQLSARERIAALFDEHSFVEIGAMIQARNTDFNMADQKTPADGVVTGYGTVNGVLVYAYSQDRDVLGGSVGEMHAKKIARIYDMALKMGAPVVSMIDSAGMRLQERTDALDALGMLYQKMVQASGVIPQITGIFGRCGGGMAIIPALADFSFAVKDKSEIFVNTPNALKDNHKDKLDTSCADYRSEITGEIDGVGEDDMDVLLKIRELLSVLPSNHMEGAENMRETADDLNRENPALENTRDTLYILKDISDQHEFIEVKPDFAKNMVTGFMILNGNTVGAIANREEILDEEGYAAKKMSPALSSDGMRKAEKFIRFCNAFAIPVLTLVNVDGYKATVDEEKYLALALADLTRAYASASVPKVSLIIGKAFGSGYLCMGSRHIGSDLTYAWADSHIGMMDGDAAVKIIYAEEIKVSDTPDAFIREQSEAYNALQNSPDSAASRGYVDHIIHPAATRKYMISAFEMLAGKRRNS